MIRTDKKLLYLVIDPAMPTAELLPKLREALAAGIDLLQIWNHWPAHFAEADKISLINQVLDLAAPYQVPVLINEAWELLQVCALQGVHFDQPPHQFEAIRKKIGREFISGLTCGNDEKRVFWAARHNFSYISFCSMFPSRSVDSCELVREESVRKASLLSKLPIFLSGGITPERLGQLNQLNYQGAAIISGIMNSDNIYQSIRTYRDALHPNPIQK